MPGIAATGYARRNVKNCAGCAGRTGGCAKNGRYWQGNGLVRAGDPTRKVYGFMSVNQARFRVAAMARVLGVSPSGYYAWRRRPPSTRTQADAELEARVQSIHRRSRGTYGAPRIHAELTAGGVAVSRKRVARG